MNPLEKSRAMIDEIDQQMAELFEKRMFAVENIIQFKKENGQEILDNGREKTLIDKNCGYIKNSQLLSYYIEFIKHNIDLSKKYQRTLCNCDVVGYQGTKGAFSHIALQNIFPDYQSKAYTTFGHVFDAVESGEVAYGVIPFENSYTGEVGEVLDLLWAHNCYINGIYDLKITQNLLGVKGAKLSDIKYVYSHHQAIGQCQNFLKGFDFEVIPYPNTALAAEFVSQSGDFKKAAIASQQTAELFDLEVLVPNINTSAENTTRFIVIQKEMKHLGNRFNLLFTVDHTAGQLAKIMQIIGNMGFNLESIKSRPIHSEPWQYYFYSEIIGKLDDKTSQNLLSQLKNNCKEFKILGTYTV